MKVITGNLLRDGRVAYIDVNDEWVTFIKDAAQFENDVAEEALSRVQQRVDEVADVYLADVDEAVPSGRARLRETIRSTGPTIRLDLGKQAGSL